ncbi:GIY-YIG nuclease family protein [Inquilinus sp.]|uniref:GIY-YIG nuclease family protein n=1 Tax=Inquilinus sp. TaxID=1932117 RepID=UPI0031D8D166
MATIYALRCLKSDMAYVGCTKGKIAKRMREHRCLLNQGAHKVQRLQEEWKLHGPFAFVITALETVPDDIEAKREAELRWQDHFAKDGRLYNEHRTSFAPTPEAIRKGQPIATAMVGRKWTVEANLKRRLAQLGKPKGHGAKISATKRARREQVMR